MLRLKAFWYNKALFYCSLILIVSFVLIFNTNYQLLILLYAYLLIFSCFVIFIMCHYGNDTLETYKNTMRFYQNYGKPGSNQIYRHYCNQVGYKWALKEINKMEKTKIISLKEFIKLKECELQLLKEKTHKYLCSSIIDTHNEQVKELEQHIFDLKIEINDNI